MNKAKKYTFRPKSKTLGPAIMNCEIAIQCTRVNCQDTVIISLSTNTILQPINSNLGNTIHSLLAMYIIILTAIHVQLQSIHFLIAFLLSHFHLGKFERVIVSLPRVPVHTISKG